MIIKRVPNFLLNGMATSNYWGDGSDGSFNTIGNYNFPTTLDGNAYVANLADLTINSGHTVSVSNRNKGLFMYCHGDANIAGILSMTGKGAYADPVSAGVSSTGLRLARLKTGATETLAASDVNGFGTPLISSESNQSRISSNGKIYTIPRYGGIGGAQVYGPNGNIANGLPGGVAADGCGGGGSGTAADRCYSGYGTPATCFSGGSGGGGGVSRTTPPNAVTNAGPGGSCINPFGSSFGGGGGAGNPGGAKYNGGQVGGNGTGGVLVIIVAGNLTITGVIEAKGIKGGDATASYYACGGGSSGGGRIIILYAGIYSNTGAISVAGGVSAYSYSNGKARYSGAGGAGKITIDKIDL